MRAYSWILASGFVVACGGSAFTSSSDGSSGGGGSNASGDTSGDGATSGVLGRAGRGVGGSVIGSGGKISVGGSATGGSATAGTASNGGAVGVGGLIGVGGDLIGVAGDLVAGGSVSMAGVAGVAGAGGTAGAGGSGNPDQSCPVLTPTSGAPCANGLSCSFGKDIRPNCRPQASCVQGGWALKDAGCKQIHACSGDVAAGGLCDATTAGSCVFGGTQFCICSQCVGNLCGTNATWHCASSSGDAGCPKIAPNLGEACATQMKCQYGGCGLPQSGPISATCDGKTWSWEGVVCPL